MRNWLMEVFREWTDGFTITSWFKGLSLLMKFMWVVIISYMIFFFVMLIVSPDSLMVDGGLIEYLGSLW